jgi:hypothetical protein
LNDRGHAVFARILGRAVAERIRASHARDHGSRSDWDSIGPPRRWFLRQDL